MSSHPIKYSTGNSWRAKQIWSKLQACWGLTCAALASAGIQTLYCVRNSTWGTPAASTRKARSIKEFLLALTNKKKSSSQTQIVLYSQRIHVWHIYNIYLLYIWIEFVVNAAINLPYFDSNGIGFKWYWAQFLYDRHQFELWCFRCILQLASPWDLSLCCCFQPWTKLDVYSIDLDFHRCEMPFRANASDCFL